MYTHLCEDKAKSSGIPLRSNDPNDPYTVCVYYWMAFDDGQGTHDAEYIYDNNSKVNIK